MQHSWLTRQGNHPQNRHGPLSARPCGTPIIRQKALRLGPMTCCPYTFPSSLRLVEGSEQDSVYDAPPAEGARNRFWASQPLLRRYKGLLSKLATSTLSANRHPPKQSNCMTARSCSAESCSRKTQETMSSLLTFSNHEVSKDQVTNRPANITARLD